MNINRKINNKIDYCQFKHSLLNVEISKNKQEHIHNMKIIHKFERSHSSWKQAEKETVRIQLAHSKHLQIHRTLSSRNI